MAVIGITGSIASGKTTFCSLLARKLSADVFDADSAAKDFLENDAQVRERVKEQISPHAYTPDGKADRVEIRRVIYNDPTAKTRLEAILHPLVRQQWTTLAGDAVYRKRHFIADIPLLFETNAQHHFGCIITVACSASIQRERLHARGLDAVLAGKIIQSQLPLFEKVERSTHVVWNDGDLVALEAQVEILAGFICGDP